MKVRVQIPLSHPIRKMGKKGRKGRQDERRWQENEVGEGWGAA